MTEAKPIYPSKVEQRFRKVQDAVEKMVREKLPGVQFHTIPSKAFFAIRPGKPSLRMDVELDDQSDAIRYGSSPAAIGTLKLRQVADGEVLIFNGPQLLKADDEVARLLLACFFQ